MSTKLCITIYSTYKMSFNVNLWPLYGIMLGINYSTTTDMDGEDLEHELQIALLFIMVEFVW